VLTLAPTTTFQDPGTGAEVVYTEPTTPVSVTVGTTIANAIYATGGTSVFAATQTLTTFESPAMTVATVTPGKYGVGTIAVTYNEAPICPTTLITSIQAAWVYSNGGTPAYPTVCGVAGDVLTLSDFYTGGITGTTAVTLVTPVSTDTLVYTAPATNALTVSVSTTAGTYPQYAVTQTLPYVGLTGVPHMVSAVVTATSIAITYNEAVFCPSTFTSDWSYVYSFGSIAEVATACAASGDVLTLTGAFNAPLGSADIDYTGAGGSEATSVYALNSVPAPVYEITGDTITGSPTPIS
jgi:hypothetical protein